MKITEAMAAKIAAFEDGESISAGSLTSETFAKQVANAALANSPPESYLPVLRRVISMARRDAEMSIQQLSERAEVDAVEVLAIEEDNAYSPEPRAVSKIAKALNLPSGKLLQLAGHMRMLDTKLSGAALRFAAQSGSMEKLSSRDKGLLYAFMKDIAED